MRWIALLLLLGCVGCAVQPRLRVTASTMVDEVEIKTELEY